MAEFHWQDGWYFQRQSNGDVRIEKRERVSRDTRVVKARATIPAAEWASIVAAVTPSGDNAETYQRATELHNDTAEPASE